MIIFYRLPYSYFHCYSEIGTHEKPNNPVFYCCYIFLVASLMSICFTGNHRQYALFDYIVKLYFVILYSCVLLEINLLLLPLLLLLLHMSMIKISLNEWFSKCHQASMSIEIYRENPVCANFPDTHRGQFYWIYNRYFHLKFKHVHKSHIFYKRFMVNKSWGLFQMPWFFFLKYIVQCQVTGYANLWLPSPMPHHDPGLPPCAPRAIFPPLAAGQAKESFC